MSENLILAGLDIGNGYVKGLANMIGQDEAPTGIDFPSGVVHIFTSNDLKTRPEEIPAVMQDIFNEMDVSFSSPMVSNTGRMLFGVRGIKTGMSVDEFDVSLHESKALNELSFVLALGSMAGKALQTYWNRNHALPADTMDVHVRCALALPISEYKQYAKTYAASFKQSTHVVTFYNFEQIVRVQLTFDDVQVLAEGAAAQYAITAKGEAFMEAMLADLRRMGEPMEGITAADVLAAESTVGIDIGEGTVNFPVYQGGRFNPDSSMTFGKGYGAVLTAAQERLMGMGHPFNSRKALADYLQRPVTPMGRGRYNKVKQVVDEETRNFSMEVSMQFSKLMSHIGAYVEVAYVYGGGASPVKDVLYPMLVDVSRKLGGADVSYPILYLDSRYSRKLNREGLYSVAQKIYEYDMSQNRV